MDFVADKVQIKEKRAKAEQSIHELEMSLSVQGKEALRHRKTLAQQQTQQEIKRIQNELKLQKKQESNPALGMGLCLLRH